MKRVLQGLIDKFEWSNVKGRLAPNTVFAKFTNNLTQSRAGSRFGAYFNQEPK